MRFTTKRAQLVYQCGIANVFTHTLEHGQTRLYQGDFHSAEMFACGLRVAGMHVDVYHCDEAGDISGRTWIGGPGELFKDKKQGLMPFDLD